MVDTGDLKSLASNGVRVQVPPWVLCWARLSPAVVRSAALSVMSLPSPLHYAETSRSEHVPPWVFLPQVFGSSVFL